MSADWPLAAGVLPVWPAEERHDLLAEPVLKSLDALDDSERSRVGAVEIDPEMADTAEFCQRYDSPLERSANCVVVVGKRAGEVRYAGCLVLATTRADVNGAVKRKLDVRKASFASVDDAVSRTGMEYGGITPFGLPADWPVYVDAAVAASSATVVGSGLRRSKIITAGEVLTRLPGVEVVQDLGLT